MILSGIRYTVNFNTHNKLRNIHIFNLNNMKEIVDYKVVTKVGMQGFDEEVKQLIKSGWIPLSGIAVNTTLENTPSGTLQRTQYSQALIKYAQK